MKRILGLDLGTNSIGWALIEIDHAKGSVRILGLGSRIIPMNAREIKDFESNGRIKSSAAQRTEKRGPRRLNERYILRRNRLHLVLDLLGALPPHYSIEIDFKNQKGQKSGQFKVNSEPKIAFERDDQNQTQFLFKESYKEMLAEIGHNEVKNLKGKRIPYDWTLYYLRQKAISEKISLEELAWVLLSYNQKRGYEKTEVLDQAKKDNELIEELELVVQNTDRITDEKENIVVRVQLDSIDFFTYTEDSQEQMTFRGDIKEVRKISETTRTGETKEGKTKYVITDIYELQISDVKYERTDGSKPHRYSFRYHNGWTHVTHKKRFTSQFEGIKGKKYDFIVSSTFDYQGNCIERTFRQPDYASDSSDDWTLLKKKTEKQALAFNTIKFGKPHKYISPRIYEVLKSDAISGQRTKIIGGLFQVVDRDFYREELNKILSTQKNFHKTLKDKAVFEKCVKLLYPKNKSHQDALVNNKEAIQHLLVEDILLYQRPLKTKKSEIANCKYEVSYWIDRKDEKTGEILKKHEPAYRKVVSTYHPYFQEFRIWDKLHNLKLIQLEDINVDTGEVSTNIDITQEYLKSEDDYQILFDKLNNQKTLSQGEFLKYCKTKYGIPYNTKDKNYVWNFSPEDDLKGNETRVSFVTRFKRCGFKDYDEFLTQKKERELWHYLNSVPYKERTAKAKNTGETNKSLRTFFNKYLKGSKVTSEVKEKLIVDFAKYPKFPPRYCSYSEKSLKKLLPLMRMGIQNETNEWNHEPWYDKWKNDLEIRKNEILTKIRKVDFNSENVDYSAVEHTNVNLKEGELPFPKGLFNSFRNFENLEDFKSIDLTKASYLVYGRHSELAQAKYWKSPNDIREGLHKELKQHSLNNPIAEKVILEMMQIVAAIWEYYGEEGETKGTFKQLFDEIHLEVGRELKKSAKDKDAENKRRNGNRVQNKRLRKVLEEFLENNTYKAISKNKDHFERLKIVEDAASLTKNTKGDFFDDKSYSKKDIETILKKPKISKQDFEKYKLWIEQGYRSPYTNMTIALSDLFNGEKYNIDHVLPQAAITNNSLSNKVICEVEVNKLKSNQTGRAFIGNNRKKKVLCTAHKKNGANGYVEIVSDDVYLQLVKSQFSGSKRFILLSNEIPKGFTNSQLNNTRYISRKAMELLSHIVREQGEIEFKSKNVLPVTGRVTAELKRAWQLNHVWTELVAPRFQRMNELTNSALFGSFQKSKSGRRYFNCNLDESIHEKDDSYNIKRIDHRHHALDALIIALCTKEHVHYINNINADVRQTDIGKQFKLEAYRRKLKRKIMFTTKDSGQDDKNWVLMRPGEIRKPNAKNARRDSTLSKSYSYKDFSSFLGDYKKMVLVALQHSVVTFKQNLRVLNKTINKYKTGPGVKDFDIQQPKRRDSHSKNNYNWAIRRSLGEATFYGKVNLGKTEKKQLYKCLDKIYDFPDLIVDENFRSKMSSLKCCSKSLAQFESSIKKDFPNKKVELVKFKMAVRKPLDATFGQDKITSITDTGAIKILTRQLEQFDTVRLPFEEAVKYFDAVLEKDELVAICRSEDNDFKAISDLFDYLRVHSLKYANVDYSNLHVFIELTNDHKFRSETIYKDRIKEHPEIAFSPENIEQMNQPENLLILNNGKPHAPIKKVRLSSGFGKQRPLNSENPASVKSKQYVVNDAGSNLYLAFYERTYTDNNGREIKERKYKDIGLMDLIATLKQDKGNRHHPMPDVLYDEGQNAFSRIFTLSPLDLVFVPTTEELDNPSIVDFKNFSEFQTQRIYKYVDGSEQAANFIPHTVSIPIWKFHGLKNQQVYNELAAHGKISISKKELIQNEFGLGSPQDKNQNMLDGKTQIKSICWKLETDRLGNIKALYR